MHFDDQTATGVETARSAPRVDLREPDVGDTLGERFLLRSVLGAGASGTVYAAIDATVNQNVAIKLLHPTLRDTRTRERLRREVRASRPGHPNIVSVFDLHEADGHLFLSMELVEGRSLRKLLENENELQIEQVCAIGRQIGSALDHLHAKGLVHRDVKPGNILIANDGTVKLCDMGLARPLEEGVTVTETEMVVGTPTYMAPEQATGAELSSSSDIYGLGLTLYQALTGKIPMKEPTAIATLSRRQRERPVSIRKQHSNCPRWLDRLIRRMLEPKTHERPTAAATLKAFETRRLVPRPRRRTLAATTTILIVIAAGIAGAHFLTSRPTTVVEVGTTSISGRDAEGNFTWQREFELPIAFEERADIDGDGVEEIMLITKDRGAINTLVPTPDWPEIRIFRKDGREMSRFRPEEEIRWSFDYDVEVQATLHLLDVDHDGRPEVIVVCEHLTFFPGVIFVYWPDHNRWDQVLSHPGNILNIRATPTESLPGLRFISVNNRLGVLGFLGEVRIEDVDGSQALNIRAQTERHGLQSPPFGSEASSPPYRWNVYVPLPIDGGRFLAASTQVSDLPGGGVELRSAQGDTLRFDKFWNQVPGPNAGRDLKQLRMAFMDELYFFTPSIQQLSAPSVSGHLSEMLAKFEPLLTEPPYRLLLDLKSARASARTDHLETAREILDLTVTQTNHHDAIYRLAHFEALSGDLDGATDRLTRMITSPGHKEFGTRAFYDGPHLALRIGIENHDLDAIEMAISGLSAEGASASQVRAGKALRARVHLWWDQLQPEDLEVISWRYSPSGEAIACLARWRQGLNRPSDITSMDALIARSPDAKIEGRLARCAALLGLGRNEEALDQISVLKQQLIFPSKDDFAIHQLLDLARALRVVALEATGQVERARSEAREVKALLTPNLLPSILVNEVLER